MRKGMNFLALILASTASLTFGLLMILISEYLLQINLITEGIARNIYFASLIGLGSTSYIGIKRALESDETEKEKRREKIIAKLVDDVNSLKNEVKEIKEKINKIEKEREEKKKRREEKIEKEEKRKDVSKSLEKKESRKRKEEKKQKLEYEDEVIKSAYELLTLIKSLKEKTERKVG